MTFIKTTRLPATT